MRMTYCCSKLLGGVLFEKGLECSGGLGGSVFAARQFISRIGDAKAERYKKEEAAYETKK